MKNKKKSLLVAKCAYIIFQSFKADSNLELNLFDVTYVARIGSMISGTALLLVMTEIMFN